MKFLKIFFWPLVGIAYALMWYSENVDGVEPKSGQRRYKHKTINGIQYVKREGLKNIFKSWEPVPKVTNLSDMEWISHHYTHRYFYNERYTPHRRSK